MKLQKIISSAICATSDRRFITRTTKRNKITQSDEHYLNTLIKISGPSTKRPSKVINSWLKAYKHNMNRMQWVDEIQAPFKQPSIFHRLFNK